LRPTRRNVRRGDADRLIASAAGNTAGSDAANRTVSLSLPAGFNRKDPRVRTLHDAQGSEMTPRNNALVLE